MSASWVKIQKSARGTSKYAEFKNQCAVVVNRNGDLLIMDEAYEQLGRPRFIEVLEDARARRIALRPSDSQRDYTVIGKCSNGYRDTLKISLALFTKARNMIVKDRAAVYRVRHDEEGFLTIDLNQRPVVI